MAYDYETVVDASTQDLQRAKRRVLEMMSRLRSRRGTDRTVTWHGVTLNEGDFGRGPIRYGAGARNAAAWLEETLTREADLLVDIPQEGLGVEQAAGVYVALADDPALPQLLASREWFPEIDLPEPGGYVLLTSEATDAVTIIGGDEAGLQMGVQAFMTFVSETL